MFKLFLLIVLAIFAFASKECPESLEIKCVDDIRAGFDVCEQAAKEQGKDTDADINCVKYFHGMSVDCWPCICYVANKDNVKVKGC